MLITTVLVFDLIVKKGTKIMLKKTVYEVNRFFIKSKVS